MVSGAQGGEKWKNKVKSFFKDKFSKKGSAAAASGGNEQEG